MRVRRIIAGMVLLLPILATFQSHAGAAVGLCNVTLHFLFSGVISNNAPPLAYTMDGGGTCQTSLGLGKTISFGPKSGTATTAHCNRLIMSGTYDLTIFPDPAPLGSSGEFNFIGTASGGEARMNGSNPTFVGLGTLAGGGLLGCGGSNSLTFSMILAFADP